MMYEGTITFDRTFFGFGVNLRPMTYVFGKTNGRPLSNTSHSRSRSSANFFEWSSDFNPRSTFEVGVLEVKPDGY